MVLFYKIFNVITIFFLILNLTCSTSNALHNNITGSSPAFILNTPQTRSDPTYSHAKQVVTLGPSSNNYNTIKDLLDAGANVFRLNFSHGNRLSKVRIAELIKKAENESNKLVAILGDIQGPKIRVGRFAANVDAPGVNINSPAAEFFMLEKGQKFIFDTHNIAGDKNRVQLPYPELIKLLKPGHHITVDDGNLRMVVTGTSNSGNDYIVETQVLNNGIISSRKGFSCPDIVVPVEIFSEKDIKDMAICLAMNFDLLAISFIQTHEDMIYTKNIISHFSKFNRRNELTEKLKLLASKFVNMEESQILDKTDAEVEQILSEFYESLPSMDKKSVTYDIDIGLIPKIEKKSALDDIHMILKESDGLMIARGDLGVETDLTKIPVVQKRLTNISRFVYKKPCIVATQMLESMIKNQTPTRAEVTDVANALYDGADAVMLSAESASGKHPIEAVAYQRRILDNALADHNYYMMLKLLSNAINPISNLYIDGNYPQIIPSHLESFRKQLEVDQPHFNSEIENNKHLFEIVNKINDITARHNVGVISVFTDKITPVNWIASSRAGIPIFAFVPETISRILQLTWGVNPLIFNSGEFDVAKETSIQYKSVLNDLDYFSSVSDINCRAMDHMAVDKSKHLNPEKILVVSTPKSLTNPGDSFYLKLIELASQY